MMDRKSITLFDVDELRVGISKIKTIGEWKILVKEFAIKHNLKDIEAINIANGRI